MDLLQPITDTHDADLYRLYLVPAMTAAGVNPGSDPHAVFNPVEIGTFMAQYNTARRQDHQNLFPISDNLFSLITVVLADLNENQRERFASTMSLRGHRVQNYSYDNVREVFIELFCVPKSGIDNPSLRSNPLNRSFCVLDEGTMDGSSGFWVEDHHTGEVGFLPEFEDVSGPLTSPTSLGPQATSKAGE